MDKKNDVPKQHLLAGTKIVGMSTMGSMYDAHIYVNVFFKHQGKTVCGRITTNTIMQMVNMFGFTMVKKRKYIHLEDSRLVLDDDDLEIKQMYGFSD